MVFLGGTVKGFNWRTILIQKLKVPYYNPVVSKWSKEVQNKEIELRKNCNILLYVISDFASVYSISEAVDDSNKRPNNTVVCVLDDNWNFGAKKRMKAIVDNILIPNGAKVFYDLDSLADYLN